MSQCSFLRFRKALRHLHCKDFWAARPHRLGLASYSFCSASEAVTQVSVAEPSSWRHLPDIGDVYSEGVEVGSRLITFETGKLARFAAGAVVLGIKETKVLSTVVSAEGDGTRDFLPLTVDYREKQYAQGKIPNTFMRREGAPKERELLCGRVIDRSIRPLFPKGFFHEVQVMANVISSDGEQDPDVMAANASSAALMISDIPWCGPIGVVRVGRIDGKLVINPDMDELSLSDLNLVYSCTRDKTLMIETQAREISNQDLIDALHLAHAEANKLIDPQIRLANKVKNQKKAFKLFTIMDGTLEKIRNLSQASIEKVFADPTYGKFERGKALNKITDDVKKILEEEADEESLKVLPRAIDTVRKMVVRQRIFEEGKRVDGRQLDEVRPLYCEAGPFPALHGSSIFSRGNTQVLCTVTLGAPSDAQRLESLVGPPTKRFMLHYSFPPFSINEIGKQGGLNRREVGHGTLAEKALLALLPPEDDFPYSVRINSEVMASDGSTSMATVCGGSMALMDAGVPLRKHVAGVSVGLISDVDPSTGIIKDFRILTDILGLEDHLGDMDFKIAGTKEGVTAIQLDMKPAGIPLYIICESLEPALRARTHILDHMEREINEPRNQVDGNSPRLATLKYNKEFLWRLIAPGFSIKKIEQETGARIAVNADGGVTILARNQAIMEKAQEKIDFVVGREIEVGGIYKGIIVSIKEYGAFVEFNGGQQGLLHISELSHEQVSRVTDVVSLGQELSLMCIGQDVRGNIKLSLKATLPKPRSPPGNLMAENSKTAVDEIPSILSQTDKENNMSPHGSSVNKCEGHPTSSYSPPSVVIRSVEECNQEDENSGFTLSKPNKKSKTTPPKIKTETQVHTDNGSSSKDAQLFSGNSSLKNTAIKPKEHQEKIVKTVIEKGGTTLSPDILQPAGRKQVSPNSMRIGDEYVAKIEQIRAHGLVLQLGGGVRGMYRFEVDGRRDFQIGEDLHVRCSSFSAKGIPVVTLLEESASE
ncbi:LOW QUALITY PROTEIN: polyribonucleotide nucleotidyltransferase 2, mitochondrial [Nymphaea colorata]|nr:LOW QUALITY PROTEIN: polyribonucleotide nucleotidyltransferase 2, mitochondrial [Nymphaea colorata]